MNRSRRVIMTGFLVEPEYFRRYSSNDPFPQVAAYKLEDRYVAGLERCNATVDVVATVAVSSFPRNRNIYLPALSWGRGRGTRWVLPNLNVPPLKLLLRFLLTFGALMGKLARDRSAIVCVYSTHSPLLLAAYLASRFWRTAFFVIIPDLPQYMHSPHGANSLFVAAKKVDGWLVGKLVARAAGVSVVTKNIVTDVPQWTHLPYVVIEGLADGASNGTPASENPQRAYFLYAGALADAYGVRALIEGFCASNVDADLLICGRGELEQFIQTRAQTDSRIKYCGFLQPAELARLQSGARGLLLTRDPSQPYTRYSFPSKLIEYMASAVPVLTTRLPGIPEEYFQFLEIVEQATAPSIAAALETFMAQPAELVQSRARRGREFVISRCDPANSMKSFLAFMESAA